MSNNNLRNLFFSLALVLIVSSVLIMSSFETGVSSSIPIQSDVNEFDVADGWLGIYTHRKSHTIQGASGAGENYQINITVNYESGTDSGSDVYCEELCQPDFGDIRFTDDDGTSLLDYWIEDVHVSNNATFWVEVKDNLDTDAKIWMYYGNPSVTNISDGFSTFIFFDDFENDSVGSWPDSNRWWITAPDDEDANNWVKVVQDPDDSSNQALGNSEGGDTIANGANTIDWGPVGPIAIGQKFRYDLDYTGYFGVYNETDWLVIEQLEYPGENDHEWFNVPDYFDYTPSITTATDTWYSWEYRISPDGMTLFDRDRGTSHVGGYVFTIYSDAVSATARYGLRMGANTWWTDDMYVRRFVTSEPVHLGWGEALERDSVPPLISTPADINYEAGTSGHIINWTVTDENPSHYELYINGVYSGSAMLTQPYVLIDVDGLGPGAYNYSLKAIDIIGQISWDSVVVSVEDTIAPTISHPEDIEYAQGTIGNILDWNGTDLYPAFYEIRRNGTLIQSGSWNSTLEIVSIGVDGHPPSVYKYTITLIDGSGNSNSDEVMVVVRPPSVDLIIFIIIGGVLAVVVIGGLYCRSKTPVGS